MVDQQQQDALDRSLHFPVSEASGYSAELPIKSARLGAVLGFNLTTGDPEAVALVGGLLPAPGTLAALDMVRVNAAKTAYEAQTLTEVAASMAPLFANDAISGDQIQGGTIGTITIGALALTNPLQVNEGGTGATTFVDGGILYGFGSGAIGSMSVLADGAIIVGDGLAAPGNVSVFTASGGYVKHESGGLEFNASAVADGDFVVGTGAGAMGLENATAVRATLNVENGATADQTDAEIVAALVGENLVGLTELESDSFTLLDQKLQIFEVQLINSAGTLQHRYHADESLALPTASYISEIANASATLANTPALSSSVDFVSGGGVISNRFYCDTDVQATTAEKGCFAVITMNTSGTDLQVELVISNANVNGTSRRRPILHFTDTATGATFTLDTTNIPSGKQIRTQVFEFIK